MKKIKIFVLVIILSCSTISGFSTNHDTLYISPNPFDSVTIIHFNIVENDTITLQVYDRWGNAIRTYFQNTFLPSGSYSINFIADSLPYTTYIVALFINTTTHLSAIATHKVVGINENEIIKPNLIIYPNPTNYDFINFSYELKEYANIKFITSDITGRVINETQPNNCNIGKHQEHINIDNLPSGIYFLTLNINGKQLTNKFIKL